ncbi:MAG: DUF4328 domain-containing protein [Flavobacteriales bacterium]
MEEQFLDQHLITGKLSEQRPNSERARQTIIVLAVILALDVISGISSYMQLELLEQFNLGYQPSNSELESNDNREMIIGILAFIMQIVGAIVFIRWFRRAYYNLSIHTTTQHSEGWAAGAWFVPILNLFRPYQIMSEMWTFTSSKLEQFSGNMSNYKKSVVGAWWFLWVVVSLGGGFYSRKHQLQVI